MNKTYLYIFFIIGSTILSGCFSNKVINYAEYGEYPHQKITKVDKAFIDSENNLHVNFEFTSEKAKKSTHQLVVNIDTLWNQFQPTYLYFDKKTTRKTKMIIASEVNGYKDKKGIDIGFEYKPFKRKIKEPENNSTELNPDTFLFDSTEYSYMGMVEMLYIPDEIIKLDSNEYHYLKFRIPEYKKQHTKRYFLLPFAIILDIITFPIQLIAFIFYMLLWVIHFS